MTEWTDWHKQIGYTLAAGIGFAADDRVRKFLVKRGLTASGIGLGLVGTRFAIEGAGLTASYAIGGKEGMKEWQIASSTMYDWGRLSNVPVVGGLTSLVPNPLGVGEILFRSGMAIGEETKQIPHYLAMAGKYYGKTVLDQFDRFHNPLLFGPFGR